MDPLAFISYRREDEGTSTRFIKAELEKVFGSRQIFMDVDNIRLADNWMAIIHQNLHKATVLIAVIGKNWLRLHDEYFRRRIDKEEDWVRTEIEFALQKNILFIPILLGCGMPDKNALPPCLQEMLQYQWLSLSHDNWRTGISTLVTLLKSKGFMEVYRPVEFPTPVRDMLFPLPLSKDQVVEELAEFEGWEIVEYFSKEDQPIPGIAIEKQFVFESFEKAMGFMNSVSKHVSEIQHHPEWENIWRSVRVRLSTWDIGHKVCKLDISLAKFMENTFLEMN